MLTESFYLRKINIQMLKFYIKRAVHRLKSAVHRFFCIYLAIKINQNGQIPHNYRHLLNINALL
jgi:hypothetical protein